MVIIDIYIAINTILGRLTVLTLDLAGRPMHCPWDDTFVSS